MSKSNKSALVRDSVRLPPALIDRYKKLAERDGLTKTQLYRVALENYIEQRSPESPCLN